MKRLVTLFIVLVMLLSFAIPAFAQDGKVSYKGQARGFIFEPGGEESLTDLFPNFKGVMPGDSLTQKITIKNDIRHDVKIKIYVRSLGAHEGSEEFLSQLNLKVKRGKNNSMPYMFDAAADETAQLSDWVYIGTLYSGGIINLDVTLNVPTSLGNEFQNEIGFLDWEFKVEQFPVEYTDPKPKPPQTGNNISFYIYLIIFITSLVIKSFISSFKNAKRTSH